MLVTPLDIILVDADAAWTLLQETFDRPSQHIHPAREAAP